MTEATGSHTCIDSELGLGTLTCPACNPRGSRPMTEDITALIAWVRANYAWHPGDDDEFVGQLITHAEAQSRRIIELEGDVQVLGIDKRAAEAERDALAAQIAEALDLHRPYQVPTSGSTIPELPTTFEQRCNYCDTPWPCRTARVLSAPATDALKRRDAQMLRDAATKIDEECQKLPRWRTLTSMIEISAFVHGVVDSVDWLRAEADRIERNES